METARWERNELLTELWEMANGKWWKWEMPNVRPAEFSNIFFISLANRRSHSVVCFLNFNAFCKNFCIANQHTHTQREKYIVFYFFLHFVRFGRFFSFIWLGEWNLWNFPQFVDKQGPKEPKKRELAVTEFMVQSILWFSGQLILPRSVVPGARVGQTVAVLVISFHCYIYVYIVASVPVASSASS